MLRIFLSYASEDYDRVLPIYKRLEGKYKPWLDKQKILPGQQWEMEIYKAFKNAHVVMMCLSRNSTSKRGFVQREAQDAIDKLREKLPGDIYIIPVLLEECDVPDKIADKVQYIALSESNAWERIEASLQQAVIQQNINFDNAEIYELSSSKVKELRETRLGQPGYDDSIKGGLSLTNDTNHQSMRIKGSGNVIGDNNNVDNRREEHHNHYHNTYTSSRSGNGENDAASIVFVILFAVSVICWIFIRHATEIYFYIKFCALASVIPLLGVVVFSFLEDTLDSRKIATITFCFALSITAFFLAQYGQERIDPELLQLGQQTQGALAFWKGLTEYGRNIVIGNLFGAISLGATVFVSLFMGIFVLLNNVFSLDVENSSVLRILNPFRPSRGGVFASMTIIAAWVFESGFIFEALRPATGQ
jgi:hypothetical protein